MIRTWQAAVVALAIPVLAMGAEEGAAKFNWDPPKVGAGLFTDALGMLDREREEYANHLADYASNRVAAAKASAASLADARRIVALSLNLSTRNKKALVLSFQLSRGVLPEAGNADFQPDVLATLLFERGQALKKQAGAENVLMARIFTELAAEIDPKNDDAVYASEIQRLDYGGVNWTMLTDVKPTPKDPEPAGGGQP
jgi:hypothetical protein